MKATLFVRLSLVGLTALLVLVPQAFASAGASVDPSTLNPPPPPDFNPVCAATGFGTLCHLQFSDPPVINDDAGFMCGSGPGAYEVLVSQNRSVEGRRYYNRDNNLTERHYREIFSGSFTNPLTGATVRFAGSDTVVHKLAVPGDVSSGTITFSGALRYYRPTGGTVLIDAGRTINDGLENFVLDHGPHPFADYFVFGDTAALQPLCDALAQ
jgi:hypothetical protein